MIENLSEIITVMRQTYGRDISIYEPSFLVKSLEKRLPITGAGNSAEYCSYLEKNSAEADDLYNSLHITFSQFFRNPLSFALLERSIIPGIISRKPEGGEIRIWSAGCANGQEAYSIAMLLSDLTEACEKEIRFRIFATDIFQEALAAATAGVYDQSAIQEVKLKHLNKYFNKQDDKFKVVPALRQHINFSAYDLLDASTVNPPESIYGDFDVVICCNLLFYYTFDLQQIIIKKLQHAMSATGYLITGDAEHLLVENVTKLPRVAIPTAVFKNNKRSGN